MFLAIGAALGSTVLSKVLGPVRSLPDMARRLANLLAYTAMLSVTVTFLADIVHGALVGHFGLLLLTLWAYTFSIAVAAAGVTALFGSVAGIALTLTLVILGNTSAGGAVSRPLQSGFFQAINPYFPHGAGLSILRGVQYFGGRGIAESLWCLATWAGCGLVLFSIHAVRAGRTRIGKHETGTAVTQSRGKDSAGTHSLANHHPSPPVGDGDRFESTVPTSGERRDVDAYNS